MKKILFFLFLLLCVPVALSAQRTVRWTVGVNTPVASGTNTAFNYLGFSVKASYERIKHLELGLGLSTQAYTKNRPTQVTEFNKLPDDGLEFKMVTKDVPNAFNSFLVTLNATYLLSPEKAVTPLAGVSVGTACDAPRGKLFYPDDSEWNTFFAPHAGVLLWRHLDVRFTYYVAPKDYSRGMLSVGYKF